MIVKSSRWAIGSAAGVLPIKTFEGNDSKGRYAIGVIVRVDRITIELAKSIRLRQRPVLTRPDKGMPIEKVIASDDQLISQFGVRLIFKEDGAPVLLGFGQWGLGYSGKDERKMERARKHAELQAENSANDQLTAFVNNAMTIKVGADRGEAETEEVQFDMNGIPKEFSETKILDLIDEWSKTSASDSMTGRSTILNKIIVHPESGQEIAVCVCMWDFDQYEAVKRVTEPPKPVLERRGVPSKVEPGVRSSPAYDF